MAMAAQLTPHWKLPTIQSATTAPSNNTTIRHSSVGIQGTINSKPVVSPKPPAKHQTTESPTLKENGVTETKSDKDSFQEVRRRLEQSRKTFLSQEKEDIDERPEQNKGTTHDLEHAQIGNNSTTYDLANEQIRNLSLKKEILKKLLSDEPNQPNSKRPTKKISFKIRRSASIYRRKAPEVKSVSLVQELTKKYNELDEQRQGLVPSVEKSKLVKRNSNALKRKNSYKELLKATKHVEKDTFTSSVKAAILIFEQRSTLPVSAATSRGDGSKPQVPVKTFDIKAIAMRNQEKRMRLKQQQQQQQVLQKEKQQERQEKQEELHETPRCNNAIVALCNRQDNRNGNRHEEEENTCEDCNDSNEVSSDRAAKEPASKMDAGVIDADELQVVSLPMGVVKRCESNYEWQKFGQYGKCTPKGAKSMEIDAPSTKLDGTLYGTIRSCSNRGTPSRGDKRRENPELIDGNQNQGYISSKNSGTLNGTTTDILQKKQDTVTLSIDLETKNHLLKQITSQKLDGTIDEPNGLANRGEMEEKSIIDNLRKTNGIIGNTWLKSTITDSQTLGLYMDGEDSAWVTVDSEECHKTEDLDDDYDIVIPPVDGVPSSTSPTDGNPDKSNLCPPLPPRGKLKLCASPTSATGLSPGIPLTTDDDYEIPEVPPDSQPDTHLEEEDEENIYESLSRCSRRSSSEKCNEMVTNTVKSVVGGMSKDQREPLPPRPSSSSSYVDYNDESNYYESIYSKRDDNYESIYGGSRVLGGCGKRHSISVQSVQSDQQSNSIYGRSITSWAEEVMEIYSDGVGIGVNGGGSSRSGSLASGSGKAVSELSGSSDDWVDISDHENDGIGEKNNLVKFVIVREARHQKVTKKNSGWSQRIRGQWNKVPKKMDQNAGDSDSDHTYETLYSNNGMPLGPTDLAQNHNHQQTQPQQLLPRIQLLPHQPDVEGHVHEDDDDFDSFESDSESDNSFAKNDSGVDMGNTQLPDPPVNQQTYAFTRFAASAGKNVMKRLRRNWSMRKNDISKSLSRITKRKSRTDIDIIETEASLPAQALDKLPLDDKAKSLARRGFLNKFKRSMSMTGDIDDNFSDRKSTFYVTEALEIEDAEEAVETPASTPSPKPQKHLVRPQMPPPPTPTQTSRSQSWYAECGVFKPEQNAPALPRRPNSFWYAEVGLYQSGSPPSTVSGSSSENSGNSAHSVNSHVKDDTSDDYYQKNYYNTSVKSYDSTDTKRDEAFNSLQGDIQLRLQDEPLYQFYDAAVLESVCASGLSDFYDDYEEIAKEKRTSINLSGRPSAMELVCPQRNNVSVARTLWCEIPEVLQSTVLSTLSIHQKKLQEAKFEMLTSEASYLNSLHVLTDHFVRKLRESDLLNEHDKEVLCGKILPVKECSGKLLLDLEKCWQDNILLHGVCDIVKRHAEENFVVYIAYCENQIVLDQTLKRLKEKPLFVEFLKQLEANSICQLLTLYSFVMLPMQRITRWPLLIDAILKRLSPQDDEYQSCQYALATLNKIVTQCNEGARNMERITEMKKLASQMEFARGVPPIELVNGRRWLVRSGQLTQMVNRGDDVKLTFGKRFTKIPIHLFLFNDIIMVAKSKGEGVFMVQHYCSRSYVELNSETLATLPTKDTQGRHLIFLTILENHEGRTVEMLLACASESDKERWLEALTPPKSENPDETLYECWDCPQVTAGHNYTANQPDELALTRGDVINVTRKMADGWYHGERMRDGETGWFPANYTLEVANPHVRARNLKQRYRLLAYSENYLKSK